MKKRNSLYKEATGHRWRHGLAALALASLMGSASAQTVNNYAFATSAGGSLHDMTGSSMLVTTGNFVSAVTSIGFDFVYEGTTYTTFTANNYGSMRLGNTPIQNYQVQNLGDNNPLISPLSVDGDESGNWSEYIVSGTAPNRVLTVHWDHHAYPWDGGTHYIFQASLYEGTNVIEFNYGTGGSMSWWKNYVAVTGANAANFLNVRAGHTVSSLDVSELNAWPGNGQVYTFTPPGACNTPAPGSTLASVLSGCAPLNTNLSLQNTTPGSGVSYQWQSSPNGTSWSDITGAQGNSYSATGLGTTTWYQCLVTCSTGPSTVASTPVQISVSDPPATYFTYNGSQITESFATWTNRCSTNDVPTGGYWKNKPAFGAGTWRSSTNTNLSESGWDNTSGGSGVTNSSTVESNPWAMAVSAPAARFHSRQVPANTLGTLDFHVDMSAGTGSENLRFEYINQFGSGTLSVFVSQDGGNTFAQVGATLTNTSSEWQTKQFTIGSTSATTVIRLQGKTAGGGNDLGVDNFRIIPAATCATPTLPSATITGAGSVDLGWTCTGCTGNFLVEYGAPGFTLGTGTVAGPFSSSPASISGLANGSYQAYVRQDCGGAGISENSTAVSFNIVAGDLCGNAINIATLGLTADDSNYLLAGNTTGAQNDYASSACGSQPAADVVLYHDVEPGATVAFAAQSTGNLSVAIGGSCPGTTSLACNTGGYLPYGPYVVPVGPWGDPTFIWTNSGCQPERVHVLLDGRL
ncbi:MAG: hypothetical protein KBH07_12945, partial [Flavobacteriales bacterium]|nr:hypothetical protein [Flavobacteriales bacterium]